MFKTPGCGTCGAIGRRFEKEGTPLTVIDLAESPEILAGLKERLGTPTITAPLFEWKGEIGNITKLRDFEAELKSELAPV